MGKKILAVDDSASMRQMVAFTLKSAGYDVVEAVDGVDGLEKITAAPDIDMVVTDLNMPNMDGIEMIRQIRAIPEQKFKPIIMLSTESNGAKKQAGKSVGATGWIVKPFNPDQLLAVVKKVLPG
ncbi:MAG: response regulator [Myxococcales bacterium]|nr:response regulator [Myxococcales bacterium]